ncbi:MAG: transposase [Bacteroidota bacterium]
MSRSKKSSFSKNSSRTIRTFSDTFKRQKVQEIEQGTYTVLQVSRLYEVSPTSVYRWLYKYSTHYQKGIRQVVEMESEAKKTQRIMNQLAKTEQALGQKQLQIDYLEKLIELASSELGVDLKKSFDTESWPISTNTSKHPDSK